MKITRYKRTQRILSFYHNNFGISPPYKVIIDGTFCKAALDTKINIREQLPTYLHGPVKLITTQCVIRELELLGPAFYGPKHVASQFYVERCSHDPKPASECILEHLTTQEDLKLTKKERRKKKKAKKREGSVENSERNAENSVSNLETSNLEPNPDEKSISTTEESTANNPPCERYFVATLDPILQESVRSSVGHPLLFIQYNCLLIEKPSQHDTNAAQAMVDARLNYATQKDNLRELKAAHGLADGDGLKTLKTRKRKKGGPNPLSCKKKKVKVVELRPRESRKKARPRHKRKTGLGPRGEVANV